MLKQLAIPLASLHTIHIVHGDILDAAEEVLVAPVYPTSNDLYTSLQSKFSQVDNDERIITFLGEDGYISTVEVKDKRLIYIHLPFLNEKIVLNDFEEVIQSIFSALMMLQFEGVQFTTVALPFLGERLVEKADRVNVLKLYLHYVDKCSAYAQGPMQFTFYTLSEDEFFKIEKFVSQAKQAQESAPFVKKTVYAYKYRYLKQLKEVEKDAVLKQATELISPPKLDETIFFQIDRVRYHLLQQIYKELLPNFEIRYKLRFPTVELLKLNYFPAWYMSYFSYIESLKNDGPLSKQSIEAQLLYFSMNERLLQLFEKIQQIKGDRHAKLLNQPNDN